MDAKNSQKDEEIDLSIIFRSIKNVFLFVIGIFENSYKLVIKRIFLIIIFGLLGGAAGIGFYYTSQPIYSANLVLSSSILSNDYCAGLIDNLAIITRDNSSELLATKLNIPLSVASEICNIEFSNYNEKLSKKFEDRDTIVLGIPFKVRVYALNNTVFDSVQTPLISYLENNSFALKRKEIKKQNIAQLQGKLKSEIEQIDSLKKNISENILPRGTSNGFVFGQPIDPINVYKAGIELYKNNLDLNERMQLIDGIQVIDEFSPREKPDSPKLVKSTVLGGLFGFLLSLLLAYFLERKKKA